MALEDQQEEVVKSVTQSENSGASKAPSLPPQLAELKASSVDEFMDAMNRVPFFMTQLDETDGDEGQNLELEALRALSYEGDPEEVAENFKRQGNDQFKTKRYKDAITFYNKALAVDSKVDSIKIACYTNRAACNLELKNYRRCAEDCKLALKIDPSNIKALFRAAKAYFAVDKLEEAAQCLNVAISIQPDNVSLTNLLKQVRTRRENLVAIEKKKIAAEELKQAGIRNLQLALSSRSIKILGKQAQDTTTSSSSDSPHIHLEDELNPLSTLYVPLLFLYPLNMESDIIQSAALDSKIIDHLQQLFIEPPPWVLSSETLLQEYQMSSVDIYAQTVSGGLAKVGKNSTIEKVLKGTSIPILDGFVRFYVVPKAKASDWIKGWNKQQAARQLQLIDNA